MTRTSLVAAVLAAAALLTAGCSDPTAPATEGSATPVDTAPSASPESGAVQQDDAEAEAAQVDDAPSDDRATASAEESVEDGTGTPPPVAQGDGCTPGTADTLPDGEWFGFLVDATGDGIEFDLACWYSGEDAELVAAERGEPEVTNDYLITNDNPALRTLPRAVDLEVERLTDDLQTEVISFDDYLEADGFYATMCPGLDCSVWITVRDGTVAAMAEQYRP